jgi:hypothetical protein
VKANSQNKELGLEQVLKHVEGKYKDILGENE